jgi:hypothetical protein
MNWRPLGHIFKTRWYAQTPTPLVLEDRVRVYFAERSADNRSFIRFVDLDLDDPTKLLGEPSWRVLESGKPGAFDSCGQMPSFAELNRGEVDLYYSGWLAPAGDVPYHNATGLARGRDDGHFVRKHDGPILDRTKDEPYLAVTPCVVGKRMWYISGLRWGQIAGRYEPIYVIRHAAQYDDEWERDGEDVIPQAHPLECFSRPWIWKRDWNEWHMWYCHRSAIDYRDGPNAYRIGYATSQDGYDWTRRDEEFHLERGEWDAAMQCYPAVFEAKGKLFMLHNGNSFGKYGFGLAVAE